jgi:transcriptional regulator with XRE-family HTH domain
MKESVLKKDRGNMLKVRPVREPERRSIIKKCFECGLEMTATRQNYQYRECGLSSVVLMNIVVYNCACGVIVPEIPFIHNLHRFIMAHLLLKETLLSGEEIRFIRKMADYSATELANTIGVSKVALSRWENGRKVQKNIDRLIRLVCFTRMLEDAAKRAGLPDLDGSVARVVEIAKRVSSFNVTGMLSKIKNTLEGPKSIRVNPEEMTVPFANFGDPTNAGNGHIVQ